MNLLFHNDFISALKEIFWYSFSLSSSFFLKQQQQVRECTTIRGSTIQTFFFGPGSHINSITALQYFFVNLHHPATTIKVSMFQMALPSNIRHYNLQHVDCSRKGMVLFTCSSQADCVNKYC
jgi:hypothetical protein